MERKALKKRITRIVHTSCFLYITPFGEKKTIVYQKQRESQMSDSSALKNVARRQA